MSSGNQVRPAQSVDAVEADAGQDDGKDDGGGAHAREGKSSRRRAGAGPKEAAKANAKRPTMDSISSRGRIMSARSANSMVSAAGSKDHRSLRVSQLLLVEGGSSSK